MIEEITPQVLMGTMLLTLLVVPVLTLPVSMLLLQRYRAALLRAMNTDSAESASKIAIAEQVTTSGSHPPPVQTVALQGRLSRGPSIVAGRYLAAGLCFGLILSTAASAVYPSGLGVSGFLLGVWIYLWPVVLGVLLVTPSTWTARLLWLATYVAGFVLLGLWASTVLNMPEYRFGAAVVPARSSVTPAGLTRLWLVVNGPPTALVLLCLNHWVRAVAPLVLAIVGVVCTGFLCVYLLLFSPRGVDFAVATSTMLQTPVQVLLACIGITTVALSLALGWWLARRISHGYRLQRSSDQSLLVNALCLFFASYYAMWLAWGGVGWVAAGFLAFMVMRLVWHRCLWQRTATAPLAPALTFLRVFSLGRRTGRLFDAVSSRWRHVGAINLITGPDLARRTVQPHQFLDYLAGNLAHHFVADRRSLERSLQWRTTMPDPDARFRINNFYCHADTWQALLPRLVEDGGPVLMDLRSYNGSHRGCSQEIRYLVAKVPFERCLLVVDESTDHVSLDRELATALAALPASAINHGRLANSMPRFELGRLSRDIRLLINTLVEAAAHRGVQGT